ncbi:FAD:protein FMN transferase [Duganella hordei]|uniref:FAD:protein FMN transferase n=1 Tax=Duganella hordei TaxID=2865934 RepID=UPI003341C933
MMRRAQPWLGTMVDITADGDPQAISAAFAEVALVHGLMSFHAPASDVSRLNRAAAGDVLAVHPHTWQVLHLAQQVADASDGMFNVGCAPRLAAWDCLPPPQAELPEYRPLQPVFVCEEGGMVRKLIAGWLDLGGIAKGYAVDLAVAALRSAGTDNACVNAGGDLRTLGDDAWPVMVRHPLAPHRAGATLKLRNQALATSSNYYALRSHNGRQVGALVDGRDGEPVTGDISVSVRAPLCAVADALTKVVRLSADPHHPALARWQASAFII